MNYDDWIKMPNPWRVVEAAATSEAARNAAVSRIIDTLLELQLDCRHENPGYQPFSAAALAGEGAGGGGKSDQAMIAAERYHPQSEWHRSCAWLMGQLPRRQAAAMLLQAARIRPDRMGASVWMVTARQMVERQSELLQRIGFSCDYLMPGEQELEERHEGMTEEEIEKLTKATAIRPFESAEALQKAARRARNVLHKWLKDRSMGKAA